MTTKKAGASKKTAKKKVTKKNYIKREYKHELFIEEYLVDFNATRTYKKFYPNANENTARVEGSKYLRKPAVAEYLAQRRKEREEEIHADQKYVVDRAKSILEADYLGLTLTLTREEVIDLPLHIRKLVQDSDTVITKKTYRDGTYEESESYKLRFQSKDAAHEKLAKHTGTYGKDNNKTLDVNVKGFAESLKDLDIGDDE